MFFNVNFVKSLLINMYREKMGIYNLNTAGFHFAQSISTIDGRVLILRECAESKRLFRRLLKARKNGSCTAQ